jgi:hypothetical protein
MFRRSNTLTVDGHCTVMSPTVVSGKNVIRNLPTRLRVPLAGVVALAQPAENGRNVAHSGRPGRL